MKMASKEINEAVIKYSRQNMTHKEISCLLLQNYGIHLSANAIQKRLKKIGVQSRRGGTLYSSTDIKSLIEIMLQQHPVTVGYRYVTDFLRHKGIDVRRDTVMKIMREVDPDGVRFRHRRRIKRKIYTSYGPNHVWHVDGYDKLKPYGFAVHGCIDGYSRKIMWLNVGPTNNDPKVVTQHFISTVEKLKGCPLILQSDPGTENSDMGAIQCTLRHNSNDAFAGLLSFRIVKSTFNQRIEAWWSMFRRHKSDWWISFFKDLEYFGLFNRENLHQMYAVKYCFMPLLQKEFDDVKDQWNTHYIARSRQAVCPGGRPSVLYQLPELKGAVDCLCPITPDDDQWLQQMHYSVCRSGSEEFDQTARRIFHHRNWTDALNWKEALDQYFYLSFQEHFN